MEQRDYHEQRERAVEGRVVRCSAGPPLDKGTRTGMGTVTARDQASGARHEGALSRAVSHSEPIRVWVRRKGRSKVVRG